MESASVGGPWASGRGGDVGVSLTARIGAEGASETSGGISRRVTQRVMLRSTMRRSCPSSRGCLARKTVAKPSAVNSSTHSRIVMSTSPSEESIESVVVDELVAGMCGTSGKTFVHRVLPQFPASRGFPWVKPVSAGPKIGSKQLESSKLLPEDNLEKLVEPLEQAVKY